MNTNVNLWKPIAPARKVNSARQNLYLMLSRALREELNVNSLDDILALQPEIEALATAVEEERYITFST